MALFGKKPPCPICGGKISWFLPTKIEGEYICDECADKLDVEDDVRAGMTMQGFKEYLNFYEQNKALRSDFQVSDSVDVGADMIFDMAHRFFCLSDKPNKTVFEGSALKSFRISEDNFTLFEGSDKGLVRHASTVPERVTAMAPQIQMMIQTQRMNEQMERLRNEDDEQTHYHPSMDIPEPFKKFNVELQLEHPYWHNFRCNLYGPTFNNTFPDLNDYLEEYQRSAAEMDKLAQLLMLVAFPEAGKVNETASAPACAGLAPSGDHAVDEIKKFKELLDAGILTQEEFNAKKKQLLGI